MTINAEIQSLSPTALIELFVLDTSSMNVTNPEIIRFHAGTNKLQVPVVWRGEPYAPLPVEVEGFDVTTSGAMPRPKIRVANVNGIFSALVKEKEDLIGAKLIRKRTFAKFLDAVNFPGGVNPTADQNQHAPDDMWFVEQKLTENRVIIEWELSSPFDVQGVMLPGRQVIQNTCPWEYRKEGCGYTGSLYFDRNDVQVMTISEDRCGKRLKSCELRHPNVIVPFGGFPGATRYD